VSWNVFYSYSHKDETLRDQLATYLAPLKQKGLIVEWHDRKIQPGADWNSEIASRIESADLVIMLLSPDFLASEYCFGVEMEAAFARTKSDDLKLAPVLMRPCLWEDSRFSALQMIPRDAKPVTGSRLVDEALKAVALEIRGIVSQEKPKSAPKPGSAATPKAMPASSLDLVRNQIHAYARLYERTRQRLPASNDRTSKMETIFQGMRGIAIASYPLLNELSNSPSPGDRLAAVSILQVFADEASLDFLVEMIGSEKPFVGYHAARALRFGVGALDSPSHPKLRSALNRAQRVLERASVGMDSDRRTELSAAERELQAVTVATQADRDADD
jgi:hypothetical protein